MAMKKSHKARALGTIARKNPSNIFHISLKKVDRSLHDLAKLALKAPADAAFCGDAILGRYDKTRGIDIIDRCILATAELSADQIEEITCAYHGSDDPGDAKVIVSACEKLFDKDFRRGQIILLNSSERVLTLSFQRTIPKYVNKDLILQAIQEEKNLFLEYAFPSRSGNTFVCFDCTVSAFLEMKEDHLIQYIGYLGDDDTVIEILKRRLIGWAGVSEHTYPKQLFSNDFIAKFSGDKRFERAIGEFHSFMAMYDEEMGETSWETDMHDDEDREDPHGYDNIPFEEPW